MEPKESVRGTAYLAVCFLVLFTAFIGTQNLMSSLYSDMGTISIAIIYIVAATSCLLVATPTVECFGAKKGLVFGAATYTLFQLAILYPRPYTLYPTATIMGVGGAVLWTCQGVYMTSCSTPETSGKHSAIFFSIWQMSGLLSNFLASFLLHVASPFVFFLVCAFCGVLSTILMLFITPRDNQTPTNLINPKNNDTAWDLIRKMMTMMVRDRVMQMCIPAFLWSGLGQAVNSIWFTGNWVTPHLGADNVGFIMCVFGATDMVFSGLLGWASDRVGRTPCLAVGTVSILIGLSGVALGRSEFWEIAVEAGLFGIGDAAHATMIQSYVSGFFSTNSSVAFALFRTIQMFVSAIAIFTISKFPVAAVVIVSVSSVSLALLFFGLGVRKAGNQNDQFDVQVDNT